MNQDLHTGDQKLALSVHDYSGINRHGVMMEEKRKHRLTLSASFPPSSYSHIYIHTNTHVLADSSTGCTQIFSRGRDCSAVAYSSADSFHGDMRLFSICITVAARHLQKQDTGQGTCELILNHTMHTKRVAVAQW